MSSMCMRIAADFEEARQAAMQEALSTEANKLQASANRWLEKYAADSAENVAIR